MKLKTKRTPQSIAAAAVIALIVAALLFYVLYCSVQYQPWVHRYDLMGWGFVLSLAASIGWGLGYGTRKLIKK